MGTPERIELSGINHLALSCADMDRTITFYRDVLGMPLVKTIDFPSGRGKHYFFDCGNTSSARHRKFWCVRRAAK